MSATLAERLRAFVGRPTGPAHRARDPVNQPMIRHWCDALGDANPVYTDPDAAASSRHGGIIAPPAMLQAWTMPGLGRRSLPPGEYVVGQLFALLDEAGFTSVVATNCDQEYARPVRLGDHLTVSGVIEAVSEEKRTGLGAGHFVTWVDTYRTDEGEVVGTMRFRVLKFRPAARAEPAAGTDQRPRPAISDDTRFFWEGVERGELLIPAVSCATRRGRCARAAAASAGTPSAPPAAAPSTPTSSLTTRACPRSPTGTSSRSWTWRRAPGS
jgi:acyl dehydratase